jgi:hypothetical protein
MRGDIAMKLYGHVEFAETLEGIVEVNLAAIDIEALGFEGRGDVGRSDRSKQVILFADLALKGELHVIELLRESFGAGLFLCRLAHGSGLHLVDDGFVGTAGLDGKLAR